jgi:hypothetical protein
VDGSAISIIEVIVYSFLVLRNELAGIHAEVRTGVDQELLFAGSVHNEEVAPCCGAHMCHQRCLLPWFPLRVVGTGRGTLLRSGSKAATVPKESGCGVDSGGGSAIRAVVSWAGLGISGTGVGVSGAEGRIRKPGAEAFLLGTECRHLLEEVLDPLLRCDAAGGWCNASKHWLGCDLGVVVHTAICGVQAALWLTSKEVLYLGG